MTRLVFLPVLLSAMPTLLQIRDCYFLPTHLTTFLAVLPSAGEIVGVDCASQVNHGLAEACLLVVYPE